MMKIVKTLLVNRKEIGFQIILHLVVFFFYASSRNHPEILPYEFVFFLNSAAVAFVINYILLPNFLYKKKYVYFIIWFFIMLSLAVINEEFILEKIMFPDTRGSSFSGILFTVLGIMPVSIILVGFKTGWDAFVKQEEVDKLQSAVKESELQFLKSQINPHFLFNNLNNLYAHAIERSPKTPEIILELSGVLRYMLYDCKAKYVSLDKEVHQLENFVNINSLQIEDRGIVNFSAKTKKGLRIAPLIMSVFVENAFKHSTASMANNIEINIDIEVEDNGFLHFYCSNTYDEQTNTKSLSSGIGLKNVKKRLDLMYLDGYKLRLLNNDNRYEVFLFLDLNMINS